ncbi:MAG: septum formation protein Maf [Clostridia bacterium]|nr:septum formation protein Maf [Clostridia bacterium]
MKIVLASASARRKEILSMVCDDFEIRISNANEDYSPDIPLYDVARLLAERKALSVPMNDGEIIIGCDTVVLCDGELMGKPKDRDDAIRMLEKLSKNAHSVISGICVRSCDKMFCDSVESFVYMREMSRAEIEKYVDKEQPYDKAGAYGIQESAGAFVSRIDGDFYNIVGLPICRLVEILRDEFSILTV